MLARTPAFVALSLLVLVVTIVPDRTLAQDKPARI